MKAKKILAAAVTLTLIFGAAGNVLPAGEFFGAGISASAETAYSGKCGENVEWVYDEAEGTITISGEGDMFAEADDGKINIWDVDEAEGYEWLLNVKNIIIGDGITSISEGAFSDSRFKNVENISIPDTVNNIGIDAFSAVGKWRNKMREENNGMVIVNNILVDAAYDINAMVIPEGVEKISAGALFYCDLSYIVVPKTCTEVCENALPNKTLKAITFLNPETVIKDRSDSEKTVRSSYSSGSGSSFSGTIYGYEDSAAQAYAADYCTFVELESNETAFAKFDINYPGLKFNSDIVLPKDTEAVMPEVPKTPSYINFLGWKLNDELYAAGDKVAISEDMSFTAQWEDTREPLEELKILVSEPVVGEKLNAAVNIEKGIRLWHTEQKKVEYPDGSGTKVRYDTVYHENQLKWSTDEPKADTVCIATFNIQGNDTYRITDDTVVLLNGKKATIKATGIDNTYECTVKFVVKEKEESSSKRESSSSKKPDSSKPDSSKPDSSEPVKEEIKLGDVNNDGTIDIEDAVQVIGHVNGQKALTDDETKRADVDGNGNIDIEDAVAIISHVNGVKSLD